MKNYKDLDLRFTSNPNTNDLTVLKDDLAIRNAIKNLVLLNLGERHFSSVGANVTSMLFEEIDGLVLDTLSEIVTAVIIKNEPRVKSVKVMNSVDVGDSIRLEVRYSTIQEPTIKSFPIIIQKAR